MFWLSTVEIDTLKNHCQPPIRVVWQWFSPGVNFNYFPPRKGIIYIMFALIFFRPVQKDNSACTAFILGIAKPWKWFPVGENFGIRNMNKHSESSKRYISPTGTLNLKQLFYALSRSREKSVKDCFYIINPIYYEKRVV